MQKSIYVDKATLDAQAARLSALIQDESLRHHHENSIEHVIERSRGDHTANIANVNGGLCMIVEQFYLLMSHTLEFLRYAGATFAEKDEEMAESFRGGTS